MIAIPRKRPQPARTAGGATLREEDEPSRSGEAEADDPEMNLPDGASLHGMFEAQAAARPQAEALVDGAERLTYEELNARANRIAHHLRQLGVGPEILVGIFLERSAHMVSAILGVLKAGGAYLPLDPSYPPERLAFMLKDAQTDIILTQTSLTRNIQAFEAKTGTAKNIVFLDAEPRLASAGVRNLPPSALGRNLAYVIYTSGSTGQPKGVALEHRNALAVVSWAAGLYGPHELAGVLAGVSICFDPSVLDLFVPLSLGGKIILAANTLALPGLAAAEEVRMINTVPSVMRELLRMGGLPRSVETVNLGGEPLSSQLADELYALGHVKRVYDLYGPTEATTCSTYALRLPGARATIGRPIAGTAVYLLDEHLRPVAAGARGELFIGGRGVARGYLNRPQLTAEKFVELSPESSTAVRLFRTGDICRARLDGELEFIARSDRQVKIRGFRVELGEIEAVLLAHPLVGEAAVVAHEDPAAERRLVAYVVPRTPAVRRGPATDSRLVPQLRSHLQDHLPDYMLPGVFIELDRFRLTANGKIDVAALPPPVRSRAAAGDYLLPRTSTEERLCAIWAALLGLQEVGVHDDFFELGGDSLLGIGMFAEVGEKMGVKLPIEAMQQARSVSRLAAYLDRRRDAADRSSEALLVKIQPRGTRARLFLVHGVGGGMLWGYANLARYLGADQPVFAFKACDPDAVERFDTIEKVAAHYVRELRQFQPRGPYAVGGYCFGGNVAYEMARLLEEQGQKVSLLLLINSSPPNSGYDRVVWSPRYLAKFLRNLGHWCGGFLQWKFAKQRRFLRWKCGVLGKKAARWLWLAPGSGLRENADQLVDLSAVPSERYRLWESHVRARNRHRHQPYAGKVVLLRSQGHRLNCSYDPQCGWGDLALRGVTVHVIPGLHDSLLEEPHVGRLAALVASQLDAIQPGAAPAS